ncbi:hypothetical protein FBQ99_20105 [Chloroflexi bacterium CFX2]|nr:hypothetical protein [Chloroflexi bacterium CFX2]
MPEPKRPLKVFPSASLTCACGTGAGRASLCHAHTLRGTSRDAVRAQYTRLTDGGVDRSVWLDKEKLLQWVV